MPTSQYLRSSNSHFHGLSFSSTKSRSASWVLDSRGPRLLNMKARCFAVNMSWWDEMRRDDCVMMAHWNPMISNIHVCCMLTYYSGLCSKSKSWFSFLDRKSSPAWVVKHCVHNSATSLLLDFSESNRWMMTHLCAGFLSNRLTAVTILRTLCLQVLLPPSIWFTLATSVYPNFQQNCWLMVLKCLNR